VCIRPPSPFITLGSKADTHFIVSGRVGYQIEYRPVCRDVHEAFLVETETLKPETEAETEALTIQAEARRPRPRPSELETETRPRRTNSEARPSRGITAPRDGLETEVSRPRPHPTSTSFLGLM